MGAIARALLPLCSEEANTIHVAGMESNISYY